jgi:uncharacterized protein (DUF885 family)
MLRNSLPVVALLLVASCGSDQGDDGPNNSATTIEGEAPAARAAAIADEYVTEYYHQFPEEAYETGFPAPLDRLGDRSLVALAAWETREDAWLAALSEIDPATLEGTDAAVPYAFARERLEAATARRVCHTELWNVSPTWTSWHNFFPNVFAQQPVGTELARANALARARDVPRFIDTEIAKFRRGVELGYTAPRSNVEAVIGQLDALLSIPPEQTPWFDPANRDGEAEFSAQMRSIVANEIVPATRRMRDYLASEYLPEARQTVGVTTDPGGRECYLASVLFHATLPLSPEEIHESGLREMERIQADMRDIGRRSFGTEDTRELLNIIRSDPRYSFETPEQIVAFAQAAVDRAHAAVPAWFGFVPEAEVQLKPYPDYMGVTGGGFYSAGSVDGSRPGTYEFGTHEPRALSRGGGFEATTFHETYPGHHMQVSVGLEGPGVHPVLQFFFSSGLGEGWALYTERLADEIGLYTDDVDRLGMLSNEAFRAARLVVDPGMHALGWTRQEAIDYMVAHTAESEGGIASEIDRYIAVPGQATAYLTGSLVIQELRRKAEAELGDDFDIREFHDLVIGDGTITLGMLQGKIDRWIAESS